ncbi:MAG: hypothetical protein ACREPQ_13935 [Rhodanobacter sp.]
MRRPVTYARWWRRRPIAVRHRRFAARAQTRIKRYQAFEAFRQGAMGLFDVARRGVAGLETMADYYHFAACPGGADGGTNDLVVDVILGSRPYDATRNFANRRPGQPPSTRLHAEQGASLRYHRQDTGRALLLLYPARTDFSRPTEDSILLAEALDPHTLADPTILRRHLRWLTAYMG